MMLFAQPGLTREPAGSAVPGVAVMRRSWSLSNRSRPIVAEHEPNRDAAFACRIVDNTPFGSGADPSLRQNGRR